MRWLKSNLISEFSRVNADTYVRVRYEDFTASPTQELERVLQTIDAGHRDTQGPDVNEEIVLESQHTVSGNPMRMSNGTVRIETDNEWQRKLSRASRFAVAAITFPLLVRYGFGIKAQESATGDA